MNDEAKDPIAAELVASVKDAIACCRAGEKLLLAATLFPLAATALREAAEIQPGIAEEAVAALTALQASGSFIADAIVKVFDPLSASPETAGAAESLAADLSNVIRFPLEDR